MVVADPTPPSARTLTPKTLSKACATSILVFRDFVISTDTALYADRLILFTLVPTIVTSFSLRSRPTSTVFCLYFYENTGVTHDTTKHNPLTL